MCFDWYNYLNFKFENLDLMKRNIEKKMQEMIILVFIGFYLIRDGKGTTNYCPSHEKSRPSHTDSVSVWTVRETFSAEQLNSIFFQIFLKVPETCKKQFSAWNFETFCPFATTATFPNTLFLWSQFGRDDNCWKYSICIIWKN